MKVLDFSTLQQIEPGLSFNPYAAQTENGIWIGGLISITFLQDNFGHLETAEDMINATESEGLKLYFDWLKDKGILN